MRIMAWSRCKPAERPKEAQPMPSDITENDDAEGQPAASTQIGWILLFAAVVAFNVIALLGWAKL
jgi:hypothetical protein